MLSAETFSLSLFILVVYFLDACFALAGGQHADTGLCVSVPDFYQIAWQPSRSSPESHG